MRLSGGASGVRGLSSLGGISLLSIGRMESGSLAAELVVQSRVDPGEWVRGKVVVVTDKANIEWDRKTADGWWSPK